MRRDGGRWPVGGVLSSSVKNDVSLETQFRLEQSTEELFALTWPTAIYLVVRAHNTGSIRVDRVGKWQ